MIAARAVSRNPSRLLVLLFAVVVLILICAVGVLILNHSVSRKYAKPDVVITHVETVLATNAYRVTERRVIPQLTVPVPLDLRAYAQIHGAETGHSLISVGEKDLYRSEMRATRATNEVVVQVQVCMGKAYAVRLISAQGAPDIRDLQRSIAAMPIKTVQSSSTKGR